MPAVIRPATEADIPAIKELIPFSVRELGAGYYTPEQIESALVHIFGLDTQLIADGTYYVAEIDGELAGCGGWSKRNTLFGGDQMKSGEDPLLDPLNDAARIRAFFVDPRWARRGIAQGIIEACESAAIAAGFGAMELAATLPGEPFYKKMGYEEMERFEVPLPAGQSLPIVRMRKLL